jgi:hypothetical protein
MGVLRRRIDLFQLESQDFIFLKVLKEVKITFLRVKYSLLLISIC